jgi:hypothetical protein
MRTLTAEELGFVAGGFGEAPNVDGGGGGNFGDDFGDFGFGGGFLHTLPMPVMQPPTPGCDAACREREHARLVALWRQHEANDHEARMRQLNNNLAVDCIRSGGSWIIDRGSVDVSIWARMRGVIGGGGVEASGRGPTEYCVPARR